MAARFATLLGLAVVVGGCEPGNAPPAPPLSAQSAPPVQGRQDLPEEHRSLDLFGAWMIERVVAPGAVPQGRSHGMVLFVGNREVEVLSQCVTIGPFDYGRTGGGGVSISPPSPRPLVPGYGPAPPPPAPRCARALSPAERSLPAILFTASSVRREASGAVILTGDAGSVVLRRPAGALANPRGQAPSPSLPPLLGAWRFERIHGTALSVDQRAELLLRPRHIEWRSGCVHEVRATSVEGTTLLPGDIYPFPICERGLNEAEVALGRLFQAPVATQMSLDGRLALAGSGVRAELAPLTR